MSTDIQTANDCSEKVSLEDYLLDTISSLDKFSRRLLKIQTMDGNLIKFNFNPIQALIHQIFEEIKTKRLLRVVILKARREGLSTYTSARFFYKTITNPNTYSMVIAHEPEATDFLFHIYKRYQMNLPAFIKPDELYNNKKMLEFNNANGTGLDSAIRVGTAGKEDFGSSQLINFCHLSELAKYPRHSIQGLLTSLFQCVPDTPQSEIIIESTAKGVGGVFYDMYHASKYKIEFYLEDGIIKRKEVLNPDADPSNVYTSIFIPFFVFPDYKLPTDVPLIYDEEERHLVSQYNLTPEIINWRRYAITNKCSGNKKHFFQEYPVNDREAFISSSDAIFDSIKVEDLMNKCKPPKVRYKVSLSNNVWVSNPEGEIQVWEEPKQNQQYIISMDVAEGLVTGDNTSMDVIDISNGRQVAHYNGKIPPDQAGLLAVYVASRYNEALVVIERNNHGLTSIIKCLDLEYPYIYSETVVEPPNKPRKRYGWQTTRISKPLIIDHLLALFREDQLFISCQDTYAEMLTFVQDEKDGLCAEVGYQDDRVLSIAIGLYLVYNHLNKLRNRKKVPQTFNKVKNSEKYKNVKPTSWI